MPRCLPSWCLLCVTAVAAVAGGAEPPLPVTIDFSRDVRPILSDACFACHGPDARKRKADLRLDTAERGTFVVPGKPEQSDLFHRLGATDRRRMPPASAGRQLTPREIAVLRRWIEQGARWQQHWAFIPPRRPALPALADRARAHSPVDAFILARLHAEGLTFSPEADRATLLRRVTLDLTGLPPTPEEADAFLADRRPDAYERVVDRLLASPRLGERLAIRWVDAARYADTSGYQSDGERFMWRWRDWVIDAYNANLPFDRFTVEQLAGDLLPDPTLDQVIATGFNRNHRGNAEGGIIPEEFAAEYVADRVETTGTVWLGLTLNCARCHDHKYDPVAQKEFYRLFAFFNNVPERGKAIKYGNSPPVALSPTRRQQEQGAALDASLAAARARVRALEPRLSREQTRWERSPDPARATVPEETLQAHFPLDGLPRPLRAVGGTPTVADGLTGRATVFDGRLSLDAGNVGAFGFYERFSLTARVWPAGTSGTLVSRMDDVAEGTGYAVRLNAGHVQVNLVKRWLDDAVRVETTAALIPGEWQHVAVAYDGSRIAEGVRVWIDGRPARLRVLLDDLNQSFESTEPFRIGGGNGPQDRFRGRLADVRVYSHALADADARVLAATEPIDHLCRLPADKRTPGQAEKLRRAFLAGGASAELRAAHAALHALEKQRRRLLDSFPTTMVMRELPRPRDTFVFSRGQYDRPGEKVVAGVPAALPAWPAGQPLNRLGLARWLIDPANPLTARVAVNRLWQMLFGAGLVRSTDDFGSQGELPSHPELLDWLAVEYRESGWDTKRLLRLLVHSATYRQRSRLTPDLRARDPENRLLGRGPRFRLPAEMIRDQALAASGLLVERVGGPSVKPYQPDGLWRELADTDYRRDRGEGLYRRGLYTFWKRTVAPPALVTFDAASRETCSVRETRTNTPLQALNLLNDVTYVEAARVLASRLLREATTPEARVHRACRLVLCRAPHPAEQAVLLAALERHRRHYAVHREAARALLRAGEAPADDRADLVERAAYTALAGILLNLDEAVTRE